MLLIAQRKEEVVLAAAHLYIPLIHALIEDLLSFWDAFVLCAGGEYLLTLRFPDTS